jgi:hypothetical protein
LRQRHRVPVQEGQAAAQRLGLNRHSGFSSDNFSDRTPAGSKDKQSAACTAQRIS